MLQGGYCTATHAPQDFPAVDLVPQRIKPSPVIVRTDLSKDTELLVLRHENTGLRRQIARGRYAPADRVCRRPCVGCRGVVDPDVPGP
jgi:hypothetical protein